MTLYSYIVPHDTGFAPNPFFGYCTLACCKPAIRRKAVNGDWIIGLTPKKDENRIVFFMKVDGALGFDEYWRDRRFDKKKPNLEGSFAQQRGDNAYEPISGNGFRQLPSAHSDGRCPSRENAKRKEVDLSGKHVLISKSFAYFGSKPRNLPRDLKCLIAARGHRCHFPAEVIAEFLRFTGTIRFGVYAAPLNWTRGDDSWQHAAGARLIRA
jgi:hypothetical protein